MSSEAIGTSRQAHASSQGRNALSPQECAAALLELMQQLQDATDLGEALDRLAVDLARLIEFDNLAVLLLDDRGQELRFEHATGYSPEVVEHWRFGLGQGIVGAAARDERTLLVADVTQDPRYIGAAPKTRTELAVPLRSNERVIGVLDVGSHRTGAFGDAEVTLIEQMARALAGAIQSRRLWANLKEQARLLSVLHEVSRELTTIHDRRAVLERMARRLAPLIEHDVFSVSLWNERDQQLEPWVQVYADGRDGNLRPMALGEGISGTAAALRQPIRVPNVALDPRYVTCDPSIRVRSELAVPLLYESRLIGVIDLESTRVDAFRVEHEQLLATLASSVAIALANAEMVEQLRDNQHALDQDLQAARKIQRQLLPRATPWVRALQLAASTESARHLGGDFYDFLRYGDDSIAIAVGDVAGKSTSAALYASLAVGTLRELASHHQPPPAEMLRQLNSRLHGLEIDRRFVALLFAVFDARSRRLTFSNAGVPYPILLRNGGPRELVLGGVPLGLLPEPAYEEIELTLETGDSVVLMSDGLCEALDDQEQEFGMERTELALRGLAGSDADTIAQGLLDAVRRHSGQAEVSDDRTVVVLRSCTDC